VTAAFKIITADPNVKGILVNIFGGIMRATSSPRAWSRRSRKSASRCRWWCALKAPTWSSARRSSMKAASNVIAADDLDDAAQKIVKAVKGS
jgi:succinyl-CoA synthetase beta subunit